MRRVERQRIVVGAEQAAAEQRGAAVGEDRRQQVLARDRALEDGAAPEVGRERHIDQHRRRGRCFSGDEVEQHLPTRWRRIHPPDYLRRKPGTLTRRVEFDARRQREHRWRHRHARGRRLGCGELQLKYRYNC